MSTRTTKINGKELPIKGSPPIVHFAGGRTGISDWGCWEFWVAGVVARCRPGADPGARFRATEHSGADGRFWAQVAAATEVRAATAGDIESWLNSPDHEADAPFAGSCLIANDALVVVRAETRYVIR